jgi:succinate-semialdehyde dehydrogenase/glutarate-semialdehyde dehydrogenase
MTLTIARLEKHYTERFEDSESICSVVNPGTNESLGRLSLLSKSTVASEIKNTLEASLAWQKTTVFERSERLHRLADILQQHHLELATIISLENGKPFGEAQGEVSYSIGFFRWFANSVVRLQDSIIPSTSSSLKVEVHHRPIGLCAAITPWNFPLAMLAKKCAAALAAGCGLICKPAAETPFSALALMALIHHAGFPNSVFNVVLGDPSMIGQIFCSHPSIRKISFTGSTNVGKILMQQSAASLQKLSLELGGNAPFVVLNSADLDTVCSSMLRSKFRNSGQACISANRFIVDTKIHSQFLAHTVASVRSLRVGPAFKDGLPNHADIGPLISSTAVEKIQRLLNDAVNKGALLLQGHIPSGDSLFVQPIIIDQINPTMDIWWEEVFGPVIAVCTAQNTAHAVELANQSRHGLGAYVFTQNTLEIETLPSKIQCGMVGVNTGAISMPQTPFGGIQHSGFGREGGVEGLFEYLTTQTVVRHIG